MTATVHNIRESIPDFRKGVLMSWVTFYASAVIGAAVLAGAVYLVLTG